MRKCTLTLKLIKPETDEDRRAYPSIQEFEQLITYILENLDQNGTDAFQNTSLDVSLGLKTDTGMNDPLVFEALANKAVQLGRKFLR